MMKGQSSTINFDKSYKEAFVQVKEALDPLVCTSPCFLQYFRHFSNYIATFISKRWMKGGCIVTETSQLLWRKCGLVGTKGSWLIYLVTLNSTSIKRSDEPPSTEGSWLWMTIYSSDECLWLWFLHCATPRRWQWAGAPCDLPELNTIPMWDKLFSHREGLPWQWYVWALSYFNLYLDGQTITVQINHQPLAWLQMVKNESLIAQPFIGTRSLGWTSIVGEGSAEGKIPPECPVVWGLVWSLLRDYWCKARLGWF